MQISNSTIAKFNQSRSMAERIPFADLQERIAAAPAIARLRHLAAQIHAETSAAIRAENIRQNQIWGRLDNRLAR